VAPPGGGSGGGGRGATRRHGGARGDGSNGPGGRARERAYRAARQPSVGAPRGLPPVPPGRAPSCVGQAAPLRRAGWRAASEAAAAYSAAVRLALGNRTVQPMFEVAEPGRDWQAGRRAAAAGQGTEGAGDGTAALRWGGRTGVRMRGAPASSGGTHRNCQDDGQPPTVDPSTRVECAGPRGSATVGAARSGATPLWRGDRSVMDGLLGRGPPARGHGAAYGTLAWAPGGGAPHRDHASPPALGVCGGRSDRPGRGAPLV